MNAPEYWSEKQSLFSRLLTPVGFGYGLATRLRCLKSPSYHAAVPVICIGNLIAGGAGKTPVSISIAKHLQKMGLTPHFLSRGYGGSMKGPLKVTPGAYTSKEVGDEPLLLSQVAPCWVARNRIDGAKAAEKAGADIIIMDDGFQNPNLAKDLSIIVVDGAYGFGNQRLIPAGPLREPISHGLKRANAVVILGEDRHGITDLIPDKLDLLKGNITADVKSVDLADTPIIAFAGIGRPEKFRKTLTELQADVVSWHAYADHYPYSRQEIEDLIQLADRKDAKLVTTEKDLMRIPADLRNKITVVPIDIIWEDRKLVKNVLGPFATETGNTDADT